MEIINVRFPGVNRVLFLLFLLFPCLAGTSFSGSTFTFVDTDSDLLADPPLSSSEYADPEVLYFSISPEAEKKNLPIVHSGLMEFIAEKTGRKVVFLETSSSIEEIARMREGKLHIAGFSTGTTGFAVNLAGFLPVCVKAKGGQSMGYHLQVITKADSPYYSLQDLKGARIAHTSVTSNSGNIAPRALLPHFGLIPDETYQVIYSGKHQNSIMGVADGTYPAAAVASSIMKRMMAAGALSETDIRILYTSPRFPTLAMGYAHNLQPELAAKIREALLNYSFSPELVKAFKGATHYLPVSYKKDWEIIRHIANYNGYTYTEAGLYKMLQKKGK